jgi:hypothetical protein
MGSSKRTEANALSDAASPAAAGRSKRAAWTEGQSAADPSALEELNHLRFEATINGRYHTSRQGWYEGMHRLCMFAVVLGGTAAIAATFRSGGGYYWLAALIPTLAGTIDLVFDFAGKAAQHARLQERSYNIVADIELCADDPAILCRRGWAEIARICAQESKTMRVVQALAYNDTKEGTQENVKAELFHGIPWWALASRHVFAHSGLNLSRPSDVKSPA